ncbi:MAG: ABC transporter permease [Planctomycetota bacterium]|nr:ABC transporter permease [Planctomycetota bacterium]
MDNAPGTILVRAADRPPLLAVGELWHYRDFLFFLARQRFVARYKQTVLGAAWAVANPLVTMVVFTLLLGRMAGISSEGFPYPVYAYLGIIMWQLFASCLSRASASVVGGKHLYAQVYFPRVILPLASAVVALVDYLIALLALGVLMIVYEVMPAPGALFLIILLPVTLLFALGIGLGLGALNVFRRDISFLVPYVLQIGLFATPALYPADAVPGAWRWLYGLNPASGLVQAHRALVLGLPVDHGLLGLSIASGLVLAFAGVLIFSKLQRKFVDHA